MLMRYFALTDRKSIGPRAAIHGLMFAGMGTVLLLAVIFAGCSASRV